MLSSLINLLSLVICRCYMVTSLHGYIVTWLHRYMVTSLHGYIVTWLHRYMVTSLHGYIVTWLHRYIVTSLHGYIVTSLHGYIVCASFLVSSCTRKDQPRPCWKAKLRLERFLWS